MLWTGKLTVFIGVRYRVSRLGMSYFKPYVLAVPCFREARHDMTDICEVSGKSRDVVRTEVLSEELPLPEDSCEHREASGVLHPVVRRRGTLRL